MPDGGDMIKGLQEFTNQFLRYFSIPMLLILVFLTIVRFIKSNIAGLTGVAVTAIILYLAYTGSSYDMAKNIAIIALIPVTVAYIFGGLYHSAYKEEYRETDRVMETVKKQILKDIEEKKITVYESRSALPEDAPKKPAPKPPPEDDF